MIGQTHTYYSIYQEDSLCLKLYVGALLLADTLNTAFNTAWIYNVLINHFGDLPALTRVDWLFESEEAMAGLIAMMVQLFYAWRILVLTKKRWLVGLVALSSSVSGLCAVGTAIGIAFRPEIARFQSLDVVALPWLVSCTVCDITIAISLTVYLNAQKTGIARTDTVLNKIIRTTVQNGLLTASFTCAHIIAYLTSHTGIHMIFNYTVVKLYTNSVMSSLNSRREYLNCLSTDVSVMEIRQSDSTAPSGRAFRPEVNITIERHQTSDGSSFPKAKSEGELTVGSASTFDIHHDPTTQLA